MIEVVWKDSDGNYLARFFMKINERMTITVIDDD